MKGIAAKPYRFWCHFNYLFDGGDAEKIIMRPFLQLVLLLSGYFLVGAHSTPRRSLAEAIAAMPPKLLIQNLDALSNSRKSTMLTSPRVVETAQNVAARVERLANSTRPLQVRVIATLLTPLSEEGDVDISSKRTLAQHSNPNIVASLAAPL